jgi:MFS family permease
MLLREPARPAVVREHRIAPWLAVAAVCFGAFMGQLDASVVTLAFPALQHQFGAGLAGVGWVSLAYLLALVAWLGLLGVGLGAYIPANNTAIMAVVPPEQAAAAGGMVNMARGLGTAAGVAVVTLALHAAARLGHASAGPAVAMAVLAACALAAAQAARRAGRPVDGRRAVGRIFGAGRR